MDTPPPAAPGYAILVAEDNLATLQTLASILSEAGYCVRTAVDGQLALRSARSQPPDLILLDVRLPDLDGFEVIRRLKAEEQTQSIPVIFITWLDKPHDKGLSFQSGAVDYLARPFDNQELLARIATHLALRQAQLELQQTNQRLTIEIAERQRAEAMLRGLHESLEQRIGERTAQLEEINRELRRENAARQQIEEALRASEAKYYALFSEMMNGCALHEIVCDPQGQPVDYVTLEVNRMFEILLNVRREEVVGRKASEILPSAELEKWLGIFGSVALTGQSTHYTMYSPLNAKQFEGNAYCPEKGKFAVTFVDVTERIRSEQERAAAEAVLRESEACYRQLAEENAHLLAQSQEDAKTRAILLHEVNHRVKNNLAAIIGLLQLELRHLGTPQPAPYHALVQDLTGRIQSLALVHNLLSASLWAPLPLAKLAENVMQIAPIMLSRQQSVRMEIDPTPVLLTPKQASAVAIILNELATNSLKHALRQDQSISLHLVTTSLGDEVVLEYRDNGPGYPAEILQGKRESVGLYLIEALAEHDLEGQITLCNAGGAVARLRSPSPPALSPPDNRTRVTIMPPPKRSEIHLGQQVHVIEKQNQRTGVLTVGVVARLLTKSASHPHGIKVMLADGRVGRVQAIVDAAQEATRPPPAPPGLLPSDT